MQDALLYKSRGDTPLLYHSKIRQKGHNKRRQQKQSNNNNPNGQTLKYNLLYHTTTIVYYKRYCTPFYYTQEAFS